MVPKTGPGGVKHVNGHEFSEKKPEKIPKQVAHNLELSHNKLGGGGGGGEERESEQDRGKKKSGRSSKS